MYGATVVVRSAAAFFLSNTLTATCTIHYGDDGTATSLFLGPPDSNSAIVNPRTPVKAFKHF